MIAGVGGARRHAAVALCRDRQLVAVCEQERVTRTRGVGVERGFPSEALAMAIDVDRRRRADIAGYVVAEPGIRIPERSSWITLDHHFAHAATAALTSPFDDAAVVVCDHHSTPEVTFWRVTGGRIERIDRPWIGPGFARLYSRLAVTFGFAADREEHKLESLARTGEHDGTEDARSLIAGELDRLVVVPDLEARVEQWLHRGAAERRLDHRAAAASTLQRHLADLLMAVIRDLRATVDTDNLCLAGGLFHNTFFNTRVAEAAAFERVFVPVNPGNGGLAVGAALAHGAIPVKLPAGSHASLPFLGPEYDPAQIKKVLDNCKLSYELLSEGALIDRTVSALKKGHLVGWFQGRMEWGPRALGNRSIVASPAAPYLLENLNGYLKHREPYRTYSLSATRENASRHFRGPDDSPFMQFEYAPDRAERFAGMLPGRTARLRLQTVGEDPPRFRKLLTAFEAATGLPALVNTSFNGFNEPIVCSPRDAVRVFYGTGLDLAVIGDFVLSK